MKINWGTGLVIGMATFISFIMYFVVQMITSKDLEHDLVTEEYYQKELYYQQEIDAEQNANSLSESIIGQKTKEGWVLTFPGEVESSKIKGTVFLYRPSNKQLDFELPIEISGQNLLIPNDKLLGGRWNITVDWEYEGNKFLYKESITY